MLREMFRKIRGNIRYCLDGHPQDAYDGRKIRGEIFWRLENSITGEVENGHFENVVTYDASILLASFMKGTGAPIMHQCVPNFGAYALGVGTGDVSWNPLNPPPGTPTQRSLYNELARKAISSTNFIDSEGMVSGVRTNIIDLTTTFLEAEAVGALTEMGILGGDIDTVMANRNPILPPNGLYDRTIDVTGKDILVNYVTFPVINKPPVSKLTWTWRLSF